ncbi:hypothetical protein DFR86_02765 [Acidianus sulfidivorans JP7]|uniref:Uncharacterized protein n=1 Tax=Acidianus sulfidivorans JP7 TaxID=619593 RepID=A0A2U9IKQ7_9CREN|nr:hypothetical protein [Acidianus sulfidivorans]AWR96576.1 hypothetical protein DFR86_02765 [Acidianus sulfidivorans JP7]
MKICENGILDNKNTFIDKGDYQILINENDLFLHNNCLDINLRKITRDELLFLLDIINKGYRYFFHNEYAIVYFPGFGYGKYFLYKTKSKNAELTELSLNLLNGKISEIDFMNRISSEHIDGEIVGQVDEFCSISNNLTLPNFSTDIQLNNCVELKIQFNDSNIQIFSIFFKISNTSPFLVVSQYLTILNIIKGKYRGEILSKDGEGLIFDDIRKVNIVSKGITKICGKFRLDKEEYCIIGDGISFHSKNSEDVEGVERSLVNLKNVIMKININESRSNND